MKLYKIFVKISVFTVAGTGWRARVSECSRSTRCRNWREGLFKRVEQKTVGKTESSTVRIYFIFYFGYPTGSSNNIYFNEICVFINPSTGSHVFFLKILTWKLITYNIFFWILRALFLFFCEQLSQYWHNMTVIVTIWLYSVHGFEAISYHKMMNYQACVKILLDAL